MLIKSAINHHANCGSLDSVVDIAFRLKAEGPEVRISLREICSVLQKIQKQLWGPDYTQLYY